MFLFAGDPKGCIIIMIIVILIQNIDLVCIYLFGTFCIIMKFVINIFLI